MISFDNVSVQYGTSVVLKPFSLDIGEKTVAIIGANGSGKSTFARLINGLVLPSSGRVLVDGLDTKKEAKAVRQKVGFIFQNPDNQIIMPTVEEDLQFGLKNLNLSKQERQSRCDEILARYNLTALAHAPAHLLSGGQKQLVAICAILVMGPEIVVFDEPTTQLDWQNKTRIANTINGLEQQKIVISHDLELLTQFERVLLFNHGEIICDDGPKAAISAYKKLMS